MEVRTEGFDLCMAEGLIPGESLLTLRTGLEHVVSTRPNTSAAIGGAVDDDAWLSTATPVARVTAWILPSL